MLRLGIYRHYKGTLYRVIAIARHTETGQALAVYHGLDKEHRAWVMPLNMFQSRIVINGKTMNRFSMIHKNPLASLPTYISTSL